MMLCTQCGAAISPALDRCSVCNTPVPTGVSATASTSETGLSSDDTHLPRSASSTPLAASVGGTPLLQVGQTFANRYAIIRLLGAGGMAVVYQAWDESLSAAVALKLIRVDPTMPAVKVRQLEERFKRELKLARQVTHPNVVRIHDLGEVGSTLYLTMAYVQGADLGKVLQRDGPLPLVRVLSLARQIVAGLAAAHRAGVVHRDLKPANIMVDADDYALITDFGIARSTSAVTLQTMPGALIGTLAYMAPEQARGEPADERTDVYSLGLILYELLAGDRPRGAAEDGISELIARLEKGPPPIGTVASDVPPEVERIISKCLQANPAARYANADELLADLETLDAEGRPRLRSRRRRPSWQPVLAAGVVAGLLVMGTWWLASNRAPPAIVERPVVSVLIVDFENRTQEPVFEGSLEQALSIAMEGAPFITAYPRRDAAALVRDLRLGARLDEKTGQLVANREGIRTILAGSIEPYGRQYRIALRAVDPDKPEPPIAVADATASDRSAVLVAIGQVAERIRRALGDTTPSVQQEAETFTAASLDAVREYTIAQGFATNQKDAEAVDHYHEALRHDPEFGRAYAGLAVSLHYLGRREEAAKNWKEALNRFDRMSKREQLRTSGVYYLGVARDVPKATEQFEKLVRDFPADSAGHNNLAVAHFSSLNFAKALQEGKKAIEIYPRSFKFRANYALYAMYASDFRTAAVTAQDLIKEDPKFETAHLIVAMEALAAGNTARARNSYERAANGGAAGASLAAMGLADVAMYEGRNPEAIALLPAAVRRDREQQNVFGAEAKLVALAEAHGAHGQIAAAQTTIDEARALDTGNDSVMVAAARLAVRSGRTEQAKAVALELGKRLPAQSRAYARLIDAEIAMATKQYPAAIVSLQAARSIADLWLVRYVLGLAYFHRGDYLAASSEFDECRKRRGEATAIFLDDLPTFRYYAPVPYWLGRSLEVQGRESRPHYEEFLRIRRSAAQDLLAEDARRRINALGKVP
jgi:eukaryotic-like serine/threonine-protein kinase